MVGIEQDVVVLVEDLDDVLVEELAEVDRLAVVA